MFSAKDLFFVPQGGYTIAKSLRFRSSASAYLSRTPGSAGNRKTWTWSGWVKRGSLGAAQMLFIGYVDINNKTRIDISSGDVLRVYDITGGSTERVKVNTTQVFRDPSAWYHIVVVIDTTSATSTVTGSSTDRVRIYINGSQVSSFSSSVAPAQNTDLYVNATNAHAIGGSPPDSIYLDGYLSEVNFIDGQALDPTYFGQTDTATGVWMPKRYTGTYGTNGFYLNFSDASGATATTIGKDSSGNGNNWTPNNISVTAGATYDSMVDTPTNYDNGGNGAGNYCVLNPLKKPSTSTIADGNLSVAFSASGGEQPSNFAVSSGKWYWEASPTTAFAALGVILSNATPSAASFANGYHYYGNNGQFYTGTSPVAYGATYTNGDVVGVALDLDTNQITFYKNNVSQGAKSISSGEYFADSGAAAAVTNNVNFGQRPFTYTPPSGFKALCTQNLPTPTIGATNSTIAANYMNAVTYNGTSASNTVVATSSNSGNNPLAITFQPDFVWIKSRSAATDHKLTDSVRGVTKALISNTAGAETTDTNGLTAFTSTGFTVGSDSVYNNGTGPATYVAWEWKAGGAGGSSNTSGSITSTVSANVTAGFSVVTYTGTGANATVGHGLGVAPKMVIVKNRAVASNWVVWHTSFGGASNTDYLFLQTTGAKGGSGSLAFWNSTLPTSTVLSIGTDSNVNNSGQSHVAYCFAEVAGYSKFGSYTGNGSTDGPFIYLGFRPKWVMIKRADAVQDWRIWDTSRDAQTQPAGLEIYPNLSNSEAATTNFDYLSNGIKMRNSVPGINTSGGTYIYAAFAESPLNYARAR